MSDSSNQLRCIRPQRVLRVLVAETEGSQPLRRLIHRSRRIRHAATQQEATDLAYAAVADVMLIDLDADEFADPDFIERVRFVSRNAFPILGVASPSLSPGVDWIRSGLNDLYSRDTLTAALLDRRLRHWAKYHRMRGRLQRADRDALEWWKSLVDALDEMRGRLDRGSSSLTAFLNLLGASDGELREVRSRYVEQARRQVAEIHQLAADLQGAAETIRAKGVERSKRDNLAGKRVRLPETWRPAAEESQEREHGHDPPRPTRPGRGMLY